MKTLLISCGLILFLLLKTSYAGADTTLNKQKNSAGITLGFPGGLNFYYGWQIDDRVETYLFAGAWFGGSYGLKSSLNYKAYRTGSIIHYLTLNIGLNRNDNTNSDSFFSHIYSKSFKYAPPYYELSWFAGPGYMLKWNWFVLTCDILMGNKDYKTPKLDLSFGYTFSF